MHYKNGREAKNGDKVILIPTNGPAVAGILYDATAGNDYCNGRIAITSQNDPYPNLKEVLHADDVKAASIPDSTAPAPAAPDVDTTAKPVQEVAHAGGADYNPAGTTAEEKVAQ